MTDRSFVPGTPVCDAQGAHLGDVGAHQRWTATST